MRELPEAVEKAIAKLRDLTTDNRVTRSWVAGEALAAIRKALDDERNAAIEECLRIARRFGDESDLPGGVNKGGPIARGYVGCSWFITTGIAALKVATKKEET